MPTPHFPTSDSVGRLHNAFNEAISEFQDENPESQSFILMPIILDIMLGFPYEWLSSMGNRNAFVEAISAEAKSLFSVTRAKDFAYFQLQELRISENQPSNENVDNS